jgi:hypothetical protein
LLAVDTIEGTLMTVFAKRYAEKLFVLLDVMGIGRTSRTAYPTRQRLNAREIPSLLSSQFVQHFL